MKVPNKNFLRRIKIIHNFPNGDILSIRRSRFFLKTTQLVIVTSYFSGFDLIDNDTMLLGLRGMICLYLIDSAGSIMEKIRIQGIEENEYEISIVGSFIINKDNDFVMIDHMNGLLWQEKL